jgi:RNA polymerase sigma-70 factor, ECF subfamily
MFTDDLVQRHYAAVFNLAYRILGCREDAEDVAQQTFAKAISHLASVREPAACRSWLLRIAGNVAVDELRRRGRWVAVGDDGRDAWEELADPDVLGVPTEVAELHELRVDVWRAALALPPQQRLALALREMHGMRYAQIAEALGTSVAAVELLLVRARQRFRRTYAASEAVLPNACEGVLERLSASIDGELSVDDQRWIDAHVPTCPNCQFAARELRATSRFYGLIPWLSSNAASVAETAATVAATDTEAAVVVTSASGVGALTALGSIKVGMSTAAAVALTISAVWAGALPEDMVIQAAPLVATSATSQPPDDWVARPGIARYESIEPAFATDAWQLFGDGGSTPAASEQGAPPDAVVVDPENGTSASSATPTLDASRSPLGEYPRSSTYAPGPATQRHEDGPTDGVTSLADAGQPRGASLISVAVEIAPLVSESLMARPQPSPNATLQEPAAQPHEPAGAQADDADPAGSVAKPGDGSAAVDAGPALQGVQTDTIDPPADLGAPVDQAEESPVDNTGNVSTARGGGTSTSLVADRRASIGAADSGITPALGIEPGPTSATRPRTAESGRAQGGAKETPQAATAAAQRSAEAAETKPAVVDTRKRAETGAPTLPNAAPSKPAEAAASKPVEAATSKPTAADTTKPPDAGSSKSTGANATKLPPVGATRSPEAGASKPADTSVSQPASAGPSNTADASASKHSDASVTKPAGAGPGDSKPAPASPAGSKPTSHTPAGKARN